MSTGSPNDMLWIRCPSCGGVLTGLHIHTLDYALAAAEQVTYEAVNAENRALREMVTDLQTRFEASQLLADQAIKERDEFSDSRNLWNQRFCEADQERDRLHAALNRANDALEKQQADLETARHERDEWHSLAVDSDREALRAEEEALAIRKSCNGKHWIEAPEDNSWEELGNA